jgi:thioredoxin-like negative regulator of GroEL
MYNLIAYTCIVLLIRCGPCQYMVPILQEVSEKLSDKIQVVKIDTEKYASIASRYRIEALPTFIVFKDGKPCYRFVSSEYTHILKFT